MESVESTPGIREPDLFDDARPKLEPATPPTRIPADDPRAPPSQPAGKGVAPVGPAWAEELRFLKTRLVELEQQATGNSSHPNVSHRPGLEPGDSSALPAGAAADYRRMENYLYRHRKEWETTIGPGEWDMGLLAPRDKVEMPEKLGPWYYTWPIRSQREYERPDPFAPVHACGPTDRTPPTFDEFDRTIDYESRRLRLRKGFEWEMDRLYLMEEVENRRQARAKEEAERLARDAEAQVSAQKQPQVDIPTQSSEPEPPTEPELRLNRVDWWVFRRLSNTPPEAAYVIDILVGEPVVQDDLLLGYGGWYGYSGPSARRMKKGRQPKDAESQAVPALSPAERPLPERVRIHSKSLLRILAKILGSDASTLADQGPSVVFVRPFKALVYCQRPLQDWCRALERKFLATSLPGKDASPAAESTEDDASRNHAKDSPHEEENGEEGEDGQEKDEDEDEDEDEETKSHTALKHLQCVLEFIDAELVPKHDHLHDPQCRKVFFADLWHLFRPGTEVIASDGKQVYRVVQVTSPPHRVTPAWQRYNTPADKQGKAPLSVTCIYIDFDGKSLGPVSRVFDFKRFEGARDVTALDVYPLQLRPLRRADYSATEWKEIEAITPAERTKRYREHLIARGRQFLAVAGVKHMFYAGPTLGVRDEVESQVVVDFETAFAVDDPEQQAWKPALETLLGSSPATEEVDDYHLKRCQASCCRMDHVHDDTYVDGKQRAEYINSLLPKTEDAEDQPSIAILPRSLRELRGSVRGTLAVSPEELLIMSYRVFAFVLRSRKWGKFLDLTYLTEVHRPKSIPGAVEGLAPTQSKDQDESSNVFSRLVLDKKHKHMIESLVAQHFRDKKSASDHSEQVDIVRGKGKGLILLLHGAPGVGKTSTAEGIAELFQKPLFQITCGEAALTMIVGDLGTTAKEVEKALETTFALANRWDCVLLLDEADVFLAQRTKEDFQRNGLVAVFLRVMEYYAGILFLTTNRVGDFDEAFTSRIHVSLYYPELSAGMTVDVFELNLNLIRERFRQKGRRIEIESMKIASFASQHHEKHRDARWNGRQIRNACQTALALAEFEAQGNNRHEVLKPEAVVTLSVEHFETVRDAYIEFTRYIDELYGVNAARRAYEDRLRAFLKDPEDRHRGQGSASLDPRAAFARAAQPPAEFDAPARGYSPAVQQPAPRPMPPSQSSYYPYAEAGPPDVHTRYSERELNLPPPVAAQASPPGQQPFPDNRPWINQQMASMYNDGNPQGRGHMTPRALTPGRADLPIRSGGPAPAMAHGSWPDGSDGRH
ncbi:hypothetical protein BO71DRAFT_326389 [Aspergillus ellipticus CBS 707.79]|uniref:AAA+ ATPase domain-containing protein n=1 Tax=Aspergillus ellipticus CBS 707.79 TaxID=1448320 RepID=A0A319D9F5_9EURO|nr:hypothetical protein BO71DRAFT_326389 [Aspergillus ellipticus CBS 707.79]